MRTAVLCIAFFLPTACAVSSPRTATSIQTASRPSTGTTQPCEYKSIASPPGQTWWAEQRWRYATDSDAQAAYTAIAVGQSPWPNWFVGAQSTLPVGTRFQMAMGMGQPENQPGSFGTFDNIRTVEDVREYLAVLVEWKPEVDRVVTFEVTSPLNVQTGPVGPQVDPLLCQLLPGRWSQFQMLVPASDRMKYLKVVTTRSIQ